MRLVQVPDPRWTRGNAGEQCSRIAKKGWSCEAYAAGQAAAVAQGLGRIGLASMVGTGSRSGMCMGNVTSETGSTGELDRKQGSIVLSGEVRDKEK